MSRSVDFSAAVSMLAEMFASLDKELVGLVLESNGCNIDAAIQQLLVLAESSTAPETMPASADLPEPDLISFGEDSSTGAGAGTGAGTPAVSDVFSSESKYDGSSHTSARVATASASAAASASATAPPFVSEYDDAALAQALADEMFAEEMRNDPEYLAYMQAEADYLDGKGEESMAGRGGPDADLPATGTEQRATFKEKMKLKLAALKWKVSRRPNQPASYTALNDDDVPSRVGFSDFSIVSPSAPLTPSRSRAARADEGFSGYTSSPRVSSRA